MITQSEIVSMFDVFRHVYNIPIYRNYLQFANNFDLIDIRFYPSVYISLWIYKKDVGKGFHPTSNYSHLNKSDKNLKLFIKFRYCGSYQNIFFIFEWFDNIINFETIGGYYVDEVRGGMCDSYVRNILYDFMDVIVNSNSNFFKNRYKLK